MAAVLNAANNALNQIYDLDIDRVNKPKRPLPSGALSLGEAWGFTALTFVAAWALAYFGPERTARMLLDRAVHEPAVLDLLRPSAVDEAARHVGQRDDRDPARRAAESGRLVDRQDHRRRRALVHRRDLRVVPAGRRQHE